MTSNPSQELEQEVIILILPFNTWRSLGAFILASYMFRYDFKLQAKKK